VKIRTAEQLYDFTSEELAWRKKELFSLHSMVFTPGLSTNKKNALLRSAITLTYAHWEGFIKCCATSYIQYVAMQRLKHNELSPNFLALAIRPILMGAFQSKKADDHIRVVHFFLNDLSLQSSVPFKNVIETQSNLSTAILRNIITSLGFDYSVYETKEKLLDEKLLRTRNQVAHGEYIEITDNDVHDIQGECIALMEIFKNQIDNAVSLQAYKIQKPVMAQP
jgi:hypothetical protein